VCAEWAGGARRRQRWRVCGAGLLGCRGPRLHVALPVTRRACRTPRRVGRGGRSPLRLPLRAAPRAGGSLAPCCLCAPVEHPSECISLTTRLSLWVATPGNLNWATAAGSAAPVGTPETIEEHSWGAQRLLFIGSPPPSPRTNRTRRVPPPVVTGHAASLPPYPFLRPQNGGVSCCPHAPLRGRAAPRRVRRGPREVAPGRRDARCLSAA
jgi:hypothetical protein